MYPRVMEQITYMEDLDFTRPSGYNGQGTERGATVYSADEREQVISDMTYLGWTLIKSERLI